MRNYKRLYFGLLVLALILYISRTSYAFDKSLDQGLDEIAQKVTKSIPEGAKKTVAVMDFNTLDGNVTMLGRFVSEELITKLFEAERFKVIERSLLEKAIEELKFNTSDLVDPSVAKQLGKVVGADAIVTGTLSDLGQSIKINARIITVESGEVIGAAGTLVIKDASVINMMKKSITRSTKMSVPAEIESNSTEEGDIDAQLNALKGTWDVFTVATKCRSCSVGQRFHAVLIINQIKEDGVFLGKITFDGYQPDSLDGKLVSNEINMTRVDTRNYPGYTGWFKGKFSSGMDEMEGTYTDSSGNECNWYAQNK